MKAVQGQMVIEIIMQGRTRTAQKNPGSNSNMRDVAVRSFVRKANELVEALRWL